MVLYLYRWFSSPFMRASSNSASSPNPYKYITISTLYTVVFNLIIVVFFFSYRVWTLSIICFGKTEHVHTV